MASPQSGDLASLRELFLTFQIDSVGPETERLLEAGASPQDSLATCQACMEEIGAKFEAGEYYLPELVVAGEMFKTVSEKIRPRLAASKTDAAGTIVLGTPQGDIHNLGKDIFRVLAESSGFEVHDLGVDVPPRTLVDKVRETGADVLGMSALVTAAFAPMQEVMRLLEAENLRERVFVLVGGGVTTPDLARRMKMNAQTLDAYEGLRIVKELVKRRAAPHATV